MSRHPNRFARRGFTLVYCAVSIVGLMGVASLGMDWGRVQTAQTELQRLADAAARAAAGGLYDGTALAKAQTSAAYNKVDGLATTLAPTDVETGTWNLATGAFVPNGTPLNAVRVTARRTGARNNAVKLLFAPAIGLNTIDVVAVSVCRQSSLCAVGIDSLTINGNGVVSRKAGEGGGVTAASNGTYTQAAAANSIGGDAFYRGTAPTGAITGKQVSLPYAFAYANATPPAGTYPVSGNFILTNATQNIAGNYSVSGSLTLTTGGNIVLYGDSAIYVAGTITIDSTATITTNGFRCRLYSTAAAAVTLSNTNAMSISVYSPSSDVTLNGPGTITGSMVGKTLTIKAPLVFTGLLPVPASPTGGDFAMVGGGMVTMK